MSKLVSDVPEGWIVERLNYLCKLRKRTNLPQLKQIANIPMALIPENGLYADFIMKKFDEIKSGDVCKEGDILVARITPSFENGKQGIVPKLPSKYAITSTEAFPLVCNHEVEPFFIFSLLKYDYSRRIIASKMEGSTGRQRVPPDVLMNFKVPVPPLVEQRGVVEVLGCVDECIRLTDGVIWAAEELKRGLMQRLLTQGIGHTEYKQTLLGQIPKTWKIVKINKIADTFSGGTPSREKSEYYKGNIPWIKSGELNQDEIFETEECITERALSESSAKMVSKNTLLMAMYGATAGQVAIARIDASINQAIAAIVPEKKHATTEFLYYYLQFYINRIISKTQGSGQPNLSQTVIKKIEITLPPLSEHKA